MRKKLIESERSELRVSYEIALATLTKLLAVGWALYDERWREYRLKCEEETWNSDTCLPELERCANAWCAEIRPNLESIFPTELEFKEIQQYRPTWELCILEPAKHDAKATRCFGQWKAILQKLAEIRDCRLSTYSPPRTCGTLTCKLPNKPPSWERLKLQENYGGDNLAFLDGKEYRVGDAAFQMLTALQGAKGGMILGSTLQAEIGQRPSEVYDGLVRALQETIDKPGKRGRGYRMR